MDMQQIEAFWASVKHERPSFDYVECGASYCAPIEGIVDHHEVVYSREIGTVYPSYTAFETWAIPSECVWIVPGTLNLEG